MHPPSVNEAGQVGQDDIEPWIKTRLRGFLDARAESLAAVSPQFVPFVRAVREILDTGSGQPFPPFCYWGWRAAGGDAGDQRIITASSAMELLGIRAATERSLVGDLCLTWCAELFYGCGLPAGRLEAAAGPFHLMQAEVLARSYLGGLEHGDAEQAGIAGRYRTSASHAMRAGAALAGAGPELADECGAFASPLGEAVQLRAEVIAVFADGALRRGRAPVLIALARERGNPGQRAELQALYGDPSLTGQGAERLRGIVTDTRALAVAEEMIVRQVNEALHVLHRLPAGRDVKEALTAFAVATADGPD
ncbi:MAG TPA: hypothetical protein VMA95_18635 [Streptosporangiaceae bacterium]|nr:hypothetical protein [Streptosporangiaceae bacterium]